MVTVAVLLPLGKLFITPGARDACIRLEISPLELLVRHGRLERDEFDGSGVEHEFGPGRLAHPLGVSGER